MSSFQSQTAKPRKVAPILRKMAPAEKTSLDLDRPASEQDGVGIYHYSTNPRSSHDVVSFEHGGRRGYHQRSTSGTSQFSTGSFVHPFQQTPRPYTPPLASGNSYHNSLRESEPSPVSALIEDDDSLQHPFRSTSTLSNRTPSVTGISSSIGAAPLRIQTKQSSSRLALATSQSSLHNNSPIFSNELASPTDTMSPLSQTVRSSIDKGFRLRSRSEVDRDRTLTIQEARRKFQEKEQAKEERAAREDIRAREKRDQKEARQIERAHGHRRSSASGDTAKSKRTRSKSDLTLRTDEKSDPMGFVGRDYASIPQQTLPVAVEELGQPVRSQTKISNTKKKTHSAWTKLMMWLRTRFIRIGKNGD